MTCLVQAMVIMPMCGTATCETFSVWYDETRNFVQGCDYMNVEVEFQCKIVQWLTL